MKFDNTSSLMFGESDGINGISQYYNRERANPFNSKLSIPHLRKGKSSYLKIALDRARYQYRFYAIQHVQGIV